MVRGAAEGIRGDRCSDMAMATAARLRAGRLTPLRDGVDAVSRFSATADWPRSWTRRRSAAPGIGGASSVVDVDGVRVFVKRVPLSDVERRPENVMSTANLFGLPTVYQYGVGIGRVRGVARALPYTRWRATGCSVVDYQGVPAGVPLAGAARRPRLDQRSRRVRRGRQESSATGRAPRPYESRVQAIRGSTANLVLFLELHPGDPRRLACRTGRLGVPEPSSGVAAGVVLHAVPRARRTWMPASTTS